jgi:hypothetical protein
MNTTATTATATADLVEGMRVTAPVQGTITTIEHIGSLPDAIDVYAVGYLTLDGPATLKAMDDVAWTLEPEHTLAWEPYEMYALRDGDSWVFIGADCADDDAARAWAAKHYPTAVFQIGGTW